MTDPRKYADKDCEQCGGSGELWNHDDSQVCDCAKRNKAEEDGDKLLDQDLD